MFPPDSKIILVEFKRSVRELDTEHEKFSHYENAAKSLKGQDRHHFLVYGSSVKADGATVIGLHACNYFSRSPAPNALSALSCGRDVKQFKEYLTELLALKMR